MSGKSLIIEWQIPREFRMRQEQMQWARDLKKEIRSSKGKRMKWALVMVDNDDENHAFFRAKRDAAEKIFGFNHVKWDVWDKKFYVRLPWWKL